VDLCCGEHTKQNCFSGTDTLLTCDRSHDLSKDGGEHSVQLSPQMWRKRWILMKLSLSTCRFQKLPNFNFQTSKKLDTITKKKINHVY